MINLHNLKYRIIKQNYKIQFLILALLLSIGLNSQNLTNNIGVDYQYFENSCSTTTVEGSNIVGNQTEKIWLNDENGGAVPTDIYYHATTDRIFVYGKRNIIVINALTNTKIAKLPLIYQNGIGIDVNEPSQYYPVIEQTEYMNSNRFAFDNSLNLIYCLSEDLRVYSINPNTLELNYLYLVLETCENLEYKYAFINYDSRLNRIYSGYSKNGAGVVNVRGWENGERVSKGTLNFSGETVNSFKYSETDNEFYISLDNSFKIIEYNPNVLIDLQSPYVTISQIGSSYPGSNTAGNLFYIREAGIHKLFCFPRIESGNKNFYVKDFATGTVTTMSGPSYVTSACFNGSNKLYISYKSEPGNADFRTLSAFNYSTIGSDVNTRTLNVTGNNYTMDMELLNGNILLTKESEISLYNTTNYTVSSFYAEQNNYFSKLVEHSNMAYVIGTWSTDLNIFDANGQVGNTIELGGIVFKACFNTAHNKIYFFNNHVQENSKVYILNTLNNNISIVNIPGSIADIEINPNTNNALISTNDATNELRIIDGSTNVLLTQTIQLNHSYIGELYVSAYNNLYSVISEGGSNYDPGIEVWNLGTSSNTFIAFEEFSNSLSNPVKAYFTTNAYDETKADYDYVYAVLYTPNYLYFGHACKFNDQNYSFNSTSIDGGAVDIEYLGKYAYVAIGGSGKKIIPIDLATWVSGTDISINGEIYDIECNNDENFLYVLHEDDSNDGTSMISKISGSSLTSEKISTLYEETNTIKYNSGNKTLYAYVPFVKDDCTYGAGGLYEIYYESLGEAGRTFYTNDDRHRNRYYGAYAPIHHSLVIDEQTNTIYYGGGGNSCINSFKLVHTYRLPLRTGGGLSTEDNYTWISIPRHYHSGGTNLPNSTPTSVVFNGQNIESNPTKLNLDYNYITGSNGDYSSNPAFAKWEFDAWDYSTIGNMEDIISQRGYIVNVSPGWEGSNYLNLYGTIEDPYAGITVYCGEENWIGYFIPEKQSVFDALGDNIGNFNLIKHQDYTCIKQIQAPPCAGTKSTTSTDPRDWVCDGWPIINYGDMIMVVPVEDRTISWNWSGNPPATSTRPEATYFEAVEQATYTSLVIELDTTENPQEIGAFVNDTCVGVCTVLPEDTVVAMRTYINETTPGDTVSFIQHFASREMSSVEINNYNVLDLYNDSKKGEKIIIGEQTPVIRVSFKNERVPEIKKNNFDFKIYPNPTNNILYYSFNGEDETDLLLAIYNVDGKLINSSHNKYYNTGFNQSSVKLTDAGGNKLIAGIYILHINLNGYIIIKKLIIN